MTASRALSIGFALALALGACAPRAARTPAPASAPALEEQASGVTTVLQAVSAVSDDVAWVAGHDAVVLRTSDAGTTWRRLAVPGADSLEFRDVEAFDSLTAYLLAAGPGAKSRIYKTSDGGATWTQQFVNAEPRAFYDCFAFFDRERGLAVSDAVDGRLLVRATRDGGAHWDLLPEGALPPAREGEGAFAASGTCLLTRGPLAWIATGSTTEARAYRSGDGGRSWRVATVPVVFGEAAGAATLAFRDARHGTALGGRVAENADTTSNRTALTADGGATWTKGGRLPFPGAAYGSAFVPGTRSPALLAAGPGGLAVSRDDGATWTRVSSHAYWAVGAASPHAAWAVGPRGRITHVRIE